MTRSPALYNPSTFDILRYRDLPLEDRKAIFENAVRWHDVSYAYSDDPGVYRAGSKTRMHIDWMRETLPDDFAVSVWNARMDAYFVPDEAPNWYWTPKQKESTNV